MVHTCDKCYKNFKNNRDYNRHINRTIPCDTRVCSTCKHKFASKLSLDYHLAHKLCQTLTPKCYIS